MMKKFLIIILGLLIIGGFLVYRFRPYIHRILTHCHLYHELKYKFFPNKYNLGTPRTSFFYKEERLGNNEPGLSPKWWFRPSYQYGYKYGGQLYVSGIVGDTDNNGIPEVYVCGNSRNVYCLDGISGRIIWKFRLPLGVSGGLASLLEDVDNDGVKELIVGTQYPLPTRVYCLSTKRNVKKRIMWYVNVHGDFIQGGLVSFRNKENQVRIIAATRDASYSPGTINVLDAKGRHLYPPIYGVDICNNRPTIIDINKDGYLDMIIGSHNYYDAKYGHTITAFTVKTGQLIWSTPVGYDTGFMQFPILDIDNDGNLEILARHSILNAMDGKALVEFNKEDKTGLKYTKGVRVLFDKNRDFIYLIDNNKVVDYYSKKVKYKFNDFPRGYSKLFLDLDQDGSLDFLAAYLVLKPVPHVQFYLFDARSGRKKKMITMELTAPALELLKEDLSDAKFDLYSKKQRDFIKLNYVLADVDNDMYWEMLVSFNSMILCFDSPFIIPKKYISFRYPRLLGDPLEDQSGFNYDLLN